MKIDKYIEELTKLRQAHGPDLEVKRVSSTQFVTKAPLPRVGHVRVISKQSLFKEGIQPDKDRGEKVVIL